MDCENCERQHDGSYGSGRFCSSKCARGFATKGKRADINQRVSRKLQKEKHCNFCKEVWWSEPGGRYHAGRRCPACRQKPVKDKAWDEVNLGTKKARLIRERGHRCEDCGVVEWKGQPIVLEMHHIDGDRENNAKENLQLLCPNCHSTTSNFGWKKMHNETAPSDSAGDERRLSSGC